MHLARVRRLRARIVAGARSMRTGQGGAGEMGTLPAPHRKADLENGLKAPFFVWDN